METSFFSPELLIGLILISVVLTVCFIPIFNIRKNKEIVKGNGQKVDGERNITVSGVKGNVTISTSVDKDGTAQSSTIDYNTYILFIDDEPKSEEEMSRIKSLRSYGFTNVHLVNDCTVTSPEVASAQFVFVDITGVGKAAGCSEGTELAVQIKKRYGEKKIVAIYSSTETHNIQVKGLNTLDYIFGKNDDTQVYLDFIEQYAKRNSD